MSGALVDTYYHGKTTLDSFITVFNDSLLGWFHVTIDTYLTTAIPTKINAGGSIELGSNVYYFAADETISGATAAGANYIRCGVSAGVMTAEFSQDAPTWDALKRGWYNGDYRYIVRFYQNAPAYTNKIYLLKESFYYV